MHLESDHRLHLELASASLFIPDILSDCHVRNDLLNGIALLIAAVTVELCFELVYFTCCGVVKPDVDMYTYSHSNISLGVTPRYMHVYSHSCIRVMPRHIMWTRGYTV